MSVLIYDVTLEEPALVTRLEGDPNSSVAYGYLPGTVLRGALVQAYLQGTNLSPDKLLADPIGKRVFFSGEVRFLNGYKVGDYAGEARRSLPVPASWYQDKARSRKETSAPIFDFAIRSRDDENTQWKSLSSESFCVFQDDASVKLVSPETQLAVHTMRDRNQGRATRESGAVFRYESLAAHQTFRAVIMCDIEEQEQLAQLSRLIDDRTIMIGGSRTGGYGRARLTKVGETNQKAWREIGKQHLRIKNGRLVVTCLADVLLRDFVGQYAVDAATFRSAILRVLGIGNDELAHQSTPAFIRSDIVAGFNRTWGLPLPQTQCIKMGSVIIFNGITCSLDQLQQLEAQGIGERRIEGFGRIALNWHDVEADLAISQEPPALESYTPVKITGELERALALQMADRLLRTQLDSALAATASKLGKQVRHPSVSQITRLQAIIRDELQKIHQGLQDSLVETQKSAIRLNEYLIELNKRPTTRTQFSRDWVNGQPFLRWLQDRVNEPASVWKLLDVAADNPNEIANTPAIGDIQAGNTPGLAYEYSLRLIFSTLALAAKHKRQGGDSK